MHPILTITCTPLRNFRNLKARALRAQQPQQPQPSPHVPWPAQLAQLPTLDEEDDEEADWDETEAAHNYDSETEPDIVFADLDSQLDPHNVKWDEEPDEEEENPNPNGVLHEGVYEGEIEQLLHPPGADTIATVAAGGALGSLFHKSEPASCHALHVFDSKLNYFKISKL